LLPAGTEKTHKKRKQENRAHTPKWRHRTQKIPD
jgi:hypothetical protein